MDATQIIKKPLVTEKTTFKSSELNQYAFHVDRRATKSQIRYAVEELYGVRVMSVNTQVRKGQLNRNRFGYWKSSDTKRALVRLHGDDRIEIY